MRMRKTTIQVDVKTKLMLDELKLHPREPYGAVVRRLAKAKLDEIPLSKSTLAKIERALEDIKKGEVYTTKQVKRRLGIK